MVEVPTDGEVRAVATIEDTAAAERSSKGQTRSQTTAPFMWKSIGAGARPNGDGQAKFGGDSVFGIWEFDFAGSLVRSRNSLAELGGSAPGQADCHAELVVAHLCEETSWLQNVASRHDKMCLRLYNKDCGPVKIPPGFLATTQVRLPNVWQGRESHTYLYHIITSYDSLPEWTVLVQGRPYEHFPHILLFLRAYDFGASPPLQCLTCQYTDIVPNISGSGCNEKMEPQVFGIDPASFQVVRPRSYNDSGVDNFVRHQSRETGVLSERISSDFAKVVGLPEPKGPIDFCYSAEFVVHRDRIRQHPREAYERMFAYLMQPDEAGRGVANVSCTDCKAHQSAGYILERMWFYVFGEPRGNASGTGSSGEVVSAGGPVGRA